ncbi:MAG: helix-turn-helix domain-containing protein [Candidatus Poseidoniaceae archaeon]|tara:strand:- start:704 stop:1207 length:504 start_codon:yes stop_codon:yes gene_type:complete
MARVRADPVTTALAHPTRRAIYLALSHQEELSTVQIETQLEIDRYNLYHHMKKLASLDLIENHRDVGRARWWRRAATVPLPELLHASPALAAPPSPQQPSQSTFESQPVLQAAVDQGGEIRVIHLEGSRDQVGAKKMLEMLAQQHGIPLDMPWNFLPESIVLIAKKR